MQYQQDWIHKCIEEVPVMTGNTTMIFGGFHYICVCVSCVTIIVVCGNSVMISKKLIYFRILES